MKRILFIVSLAGVLLASCTGDVPEIVLERSEMDIGEITNGEVRTINIEVRNTGEGDLIIEAVTTSCGCTTAQIEPMTISPGGKGVLDITYDSGAHGPDITGPVIRQVFIASNDPNAPEVEFRFTAEVVSANT